MTDVILVDKKDYVGYVTLNRPEKLNALTASMYAAIRDIMEQLDEDDEVRVVVMRGNGRAFSAGYDLTQQGVQEPHARLRVLEKMANAARWKIWSLKKPVIAEVHGYCLGGACELVLPCDFVLISEDCVIGEPEIQFGEPAAFLIMPWIVGLRKGKELLLTGDKISGKEAASIGLVTKAFPSDSLRQEVEALADKLKKIPVPAMLLQKRGINRQFEVMGLKAGLDSWVDMAILTGLIETDEVKEFNEILHTQGMKAAFAWRDQKFEQKG